MTPTGWCPGVRAGENEISATQRQLGEYPGTQTVRKFFPQQLGGWDGALSLLQPGMTAVVSYHGFAAPIAAFAAAIPPGVTVKLSPWHEPEKKITPAQLLGEFRHLDTVIPRTHPLRAAGILQFGPTMTVYRARIGAPADLRRFITPDLVALVDFVGWDWYPSNPAEATPTHPAAYEPPETAFKLMVDFAAETGLPWAVSEFNHEDIPGTTAAAWYRSAHAHAKANGCRWWAHFHRGGGDLTSPPAPRPDTAAALRDLIGQEASMSRVKSLGGYPIEQHSSPNIGGAMTGHKGLVLHIAEGTYQGTISWQMNPDQRYGDGTTVTTSSTFVVGRNPGEWAQMVDTDRIAWCQRSGSYDWLSIELAGYAPNPPTDWQVEACAQLLAWANQRYGVPIQVATTTSGRGLGHHSMDNDTTVEWGHDSCPGSGVINAKSAIVARAKAIAAGEDDTMTPAQFADILKDPTVATLMRALPWQYTGGGIPAGMSTLGVVNELIVRARAAGDGADESAIVAGVLAGLAPEKIADAVVAALPATDAKALADELAARLAS